MTYILEKDYCFTSIFTQRHQVSQKSEYEAWTPEGIQVIVYSRILLCYWWTSNSYLFSVCLLSSSSSKPL